VGDRKFASDPQNRYPRSLAALETTELLLGVKQVQSSVEKKAPSYGHRPNTKNATPTTVAATTGASTVATTTKGIL
jgi:hypothetical protein